MEKIKYAKCSFNKETGLIHDSDLEWFEGTEEEACKSVRDDSTTCALFLPKDVLGKGNPVNPEVSRSVFEAEPAIYGVCYYKGWSGYVFE